MQLVDRCRKKLCEFVFILVHQFYFVASSLKITGLENTDNNLEPQCITSWFSNEVIIKGADSVMMMTLPISHSRWSIYGRKLCGRIEEIREYLKLGWWASGWRFDLQTSCLLSSSVSDQLQQSVFDAFKTFYIGSPKRYQMWKHISTANFHSIFYGVPLNLTLLKMLHLARNILDNQYSYCDMYSRCCLTGRTETEPDLRGRPAQKILEGLEWRVLSFESFIKDRLSGRTNGSKVFEIINSRQENQWLSKSIFKDTLNIYIYKIQKYSEASATTAPYNPYMYKQHVYYTYIRCDNHEIGEYTRHIFWQRFGKHFPATTKLQAKIGVFCGPCRDRCYITAWKIRLCNNRRAVFSTWSVSRNYPEDKCNDPVERQFFTESYDDWTLSMWNRRVATARRRCRVTVGEDTAGWKKLSVCTSDLSVWKSATELKYVGQSKSFRNSPADGGRAIS
jgi:hypothetical protein